MKSKLKYTTTLNKEDKLEDIVKRAILHSIGMIEDASTMLNKKEFNGTKKLQITISVVDK